MDGSYRAFVWGQSQDCYLKAVSYGGFDSLENGFAVVHGTDANLEVTLSSRGARVQGAVSDSEGLPSVGVWVVLVPDGAHRGKHDFYQTAQTDQHGQYVVRGIAPGDYKLFSWNEVEDDEWEDPDFMKRFEGNGEGVSVREGDSKTIDLTAIKTNTTEQQKP